MDRTKPKRTWTRPRILMAAGGSLLALLLLYSFLLADRRSRLNVDPERLSIQTVKQDGFLEYIPVTGTIQPIQTIFIDATQGGQVSRIYRESGAMVQADEPLVALTNAQQELSYMMQETQTTEQINTLRNTRLNLEQNSLNLANQLAEVDYQIGIAKPQYLRMKGLHEQGIVSTRDWEQAREQFQYQVERRRNTYSSYRRDSLLRIAQSAQLDQQEAAMLAQLAQIRELRQNLIVRAPAAGQFAGAELQVGQNINPGSRIGQIDVLDAFKARIRIDELYLPRVDVGQQGSFDFDGKSYKVQISKVFPTIAEGRFEVDMTFTGPMPTGIRRGQTVYVRLSLGNPGQALLLPVGGFFQSTGGNWVYVLESDGSRAVKRPIRLGRKNPDYYEVLEGLKPGDRVITNSYETFGDNEVLELK